MFSFVLGDLASFEPFVFAGPGLGERRKSEKEQDNQKSADGGVHVITLRQKGLLKSGKN
jgi:hypothetical protein